MRKLESVLADPTRKRAHNRRLFTTVAPRYDLVTRVLSFGRDRAWKRALVSRLPELDALSAPPGFVLDLACGTGDITFALARRYPKAQVVGLDLNPEMLAFARRRAEGVPGRLTFEEGDMQELPFDDGSVNIVTGGYALRNAPDLATTLTEIRRVLAPGGTVAFLEFSRSHRAAPAAAQLALLRFWGRLWGRVLHRDPEVYGYIAESLAAFPDLKTFESKLRRAGFSGVCSRRFMFGLLAITWGRANREAKHSGPAAAGGCSAG